MMSWGYKIAILYGGFVALIATLVTLSMRQKVDLVSADYYQQELKYQDRIDAMTRTQGLAGNLKWMRKDKTLLICFPKTTDHKRISGEVFFFRPSDADLDRRVKVPAVHNDTCRISLKGLETGFYKMEISWSAGSGEYYNEGTIQIP